MVNKESNEITEITMENTTKFNLKIQKKISLQY